MSDDPIVKVLRESMEREAAARAARDRLLTSVKRWLEPAVREGLARIEPGAAGSWRVVCGYHVVTVEPAEAPMLVRLHRGYRLAYIGARGDQFYLAKGPGFEVPLTQRSFEHLVMELFGGEPHEAA